jgi:predicted transcriptional regulator
MVRISVELPDEVAEALARAALSRAATPESILAEAAHAIAAAHGEEAERPDDGFEAFLATPGAFAAFVAPAMDDVAAGRLVDHAEVFAELDAIVATALARKAG